MAVVAPMPMATDRMPARANPGFLRRLRAEWRRSSANMRALVPGVATLLRGYSGHRSATRPDENVGETPTCPAESEPHDGVPHRRGVPSGAYSISGPTWP